MIYKRILVGSLIATSLLFAVDSAEININNNTLEIAGEYSLNDTYALNDDSNYFFTISYMSSEQATGTTSKPKLTTAGFKIMNPYIDDRGLSLGLGIKGVWADNYNKSFVATPLTAFAKYEINELVTLDLSVGYAPKILTYSEGDKYATTNLKANFKVIDNGYTYLGLRSIKTDYKDGTSIKFDDSVFFGYKVQF